MSAQKINEPTEAFLFNCKVCKQPGVTQWVPNTMFTIERWKSWLCCNRCADFMAVRSKISNKIVSLCTRLYTARRFNAKDVNELEVAIREKLSEATKILARATCDYYRITRVWDEDFVAQLVEQPEKAWAVLRVYHRGIKQLAAQPVPA